MRGGTGPHIAREAVDPAAGSNMNRFPAVTAVTAAVALVLASGCASVVNGPDQAVGISSAPSGAAVLVDGEPVGTTPMIAKLDRGGNHIVSLSKPGFERRDLTLTRSLSAWTFGNALFGYLGLLGLAVDAGTGGMHRLHPEAIDATLHGANEGGASGPAGVPPSPEPDRSTFVAPDARTAVVPVAPTRSERTWRPREGLYFGAMLSASSYLPLPMPSVEIGHEFDRLGVRARLSPPIMGRQAVEASCALDAARRIRAYVTGGYDVRYFDFYGFGGLGIEWRTRPSNWFVQLDVTTGNVRDLDGDDGEDVDELGRRSAIGLAFGIRTP